jgi:SAM-dependent methyltransferase
VPAALQKYLAKMPRGARVLIPGCGSAYEAGYLAEHRFDVLAIDFSPAAVELAKTNLSRFGDIVKLADFFEFDYGTPYDVIYERAFLCALPPRMWPQYAPRTVQLLRPGGELAGFFFFKATEKGPPFGTTPEALQALLDPYFELVEDKAVTDSIPVFEGSERWQVWRRK